MDINTRYEICDTIAQKWADQADPQEWKQYFFKAQWEWLNSMPDHELLEIVERVRHESD